MKNLLEISRCVVRNLRADSRRNIFRSVKLRCSNVKIERQGVREEVDKSNCGIYKQVVEHPYQKETCQVIR